MLAILIVTVMPVKGLQIFWYLNNMSLGLGNKKSLTLKKKNMPPLVSVIVPVYKVEDVLPRCLDSLCRQSLYNIEILLIDDASPDQCGAICDAYEEKDSRFRVVRHLQNRGLSAARNIGIRLAKAEYIMFVDSDDWVHEDFCRLPYEYAVRYQVDLVLFHYQRIYKNGSFKFAQEKEISKTGIKTQIEALDLLFAAVGCAAWNKLYKKTLFDTVSYPEGYLYEDIGTTYRTVLLADSIYYLNETLYFKCYHDGSITTLKTRKALQDWTTMAMRRYRDLAAWGYPEEKLAFLKKNYALSYCIRAKREKEDTNYILCLEELQSVKRIPSEFTWKRKVLFLLLKYCPPVFDLVCNLWGKRWNVVK